MYQGFCAPMVELRTDECAFIGDSKQFFEGLSTAMAVGLRIDCLEILFAASVWRVGEMDEYLILIGQVANHGLSHPKGGGVPDDKTRTRARFAEQITPNQIGTLHHGALLERSSEHAGASFRRFHRGRRPPTIFSVRLAL